MPLWSNQGVEPTWLLRETGYSGLKANPKIPSNQTKKTCSNIKQTCCWLPGSAWSVAVPGSARDHENAGVGAVRVDDDDDEDDELLEIGDDANDELPESAVEDGGGDDVILDWTYRK